MVKHTKNFNSDLRNFRESEINILDEAVGITNVKIQRFPFATKPTFIIKE